MSYTAIKDKVMIDGRDSLADSTPMRRLGNEYHRRERRPRDYRHPRRVKQRQSAHEETAAGKECRGSCKDRCSHDDTVHRKQSKASPPTMETRLPITSSSHNVSKQRFTSHVQFVEFAIQLRKVVCSSARAKGKKQQHKGYSIRYECHG